MPWPRRNRYQDIIPVLQEIYERTGEWPTLAELAAHYDAQRPRVRRWITILEQHRAVEVWEPADRSALYIKPTGKWTKYRYR